MSFGGVLERQWVPKGFQNGIGRASAQQSKSGSKRNLISWIYRNAGGGFRDSESIYNSPRIEARSEDVSKGFWSLQRYVGGLVRRVSDGKTSTCSSWAPTGRPARALRVRTLFGS